MLGKARKRMRLTQEVVAREIGISRSFYGLIETGKRRPTYGMAVKLAELLKCPIGDLFFDIEGFKLNHNNKPRKAG